MSDLRSQLTQITTDFVSAVLVAMRGAALSDLVGESVRASASAAPARGRAAKIAPTQAAVRGRRLRASAAQVQAQKDAALAAAKTLKPGFAKSDVMKKSASKVDLGRALSLLVAEGKLTKKGDRRLARYSVK
jgi:hypothetical protein